MIDYQFQFAMGLTDARRRDQMLGEVTSCVLGHLGYAEPAAAAILGHMRHAVQSAIAEGCEDCTLHFRVDAGQLDIVVSHHRGREWRTTRALP